MEGGRRAHLREARGFYDCMASQVCHRFLYPGLQRPRLRGITELHFIRQSRKFTHIRNRLLKERAKFNNRFL
ncbi:hypothetical protein GCM10022398_31450 [Acetobacter lovaniensis]|nr:hypothetical protein AA0474_3132 [Acetobacter lovaniensis NRIC 0474]